MYASYSFPPSLYRTQAASGTEEHRERLEGRGEGGRGEEEGGRGGIKLNDGDNTRLTKYWMLTFSNFSYISTPKELLLLVTH